MIRKLWTHKKSGTQYVVVSLGSMKLNGTWLADCIVTYHKKFEPERVYHRFMDDFQESFTEVLENGS